MSFLVPTLLLALLAGAAWTDLRRREVPNWIVAALAALWLAQASFLPGATVATALAVASALLAGGIVCWHLGWIGAGDAKLLAALGLWSTGHLMELLLTTALAGGVLAVGQLLRARLWHRAVPPSAPGPTGSLPYAVAIAIAGFWLVLGRDLTAGVF